MSTIGQYHARRGLTLAFTSIRRTIHLRAKPMTILMFLPKLFSTESSIMPISSLHRPISSHSALRPRNPEMQQDGLSPAIWWRNIKPEMHRFGTRTSAQCKWILQSFQTSYLASSSKSQLESCHHNSASREDDALTVSSYEINTIHKASISNNLLSGCDLEMIVTYLLQCCLIIVLSTIHR